MTSSREDGVASFSIDHLAEARGEIENMIERGETFCIMVPKSSKRFFAVTRFLAALGGERDARSAWRALVDAWRIRDLVTFLGLAEQAKYGRRLDDTAEGLTILFQRQST